MVGVGVGMNKKERSREKQQKKKKKRKRKEEAGGVDNTEAVGSTESEIYNGATKLCISVFENT